MCDICSILFFFFFFFNDTATTEIYTLSLHDALPISILDSIDIIGGIRDRDWWRVAAGTLGIIGTGLAIAARSEEHTSELQSRQYLVCRLLLEKKKKNTTTEPSHITSS